MNGQMKLSEWAAKRQIEDPINEKIAAEFLIHLHEISQVKSLS